jgi:UDP-N-acetylglucosamine 4,6-dehydratase
MTLDLNGHTLLVTGGTGSFGKAFTRRMLKEYPDVVLRIFSRDELKQSEMATEFDHDHRLRFFVGDVRSRERLARATKGVDHIIHAAAMKQVPACEYNPFEAIQTNVLGSQHIVDAAIDNGVRTVVALSTDKAVNPVNLYGATKLCEEKLIVQGNAYASGSDAKLCCVRYGNVVGSRGSVVPVFREQIESGRLTITDSRMTRFWITLDEAVDLVLYALEHTDGGEVFVPKIPSMKVVDLAAAMAPGMETTEIGIRPGEKLHESLLTADEARQSVDAGDVYVVLPEHPWWTTESRWHDCAPLPEEFAYTSDRNDEWLDADRLTSLLG